MSGRRPLDPVLPPAFATRTCRGAACNGGERVLEGVYHLLQLSCMFLAHLVHGLRAWLLPLRCRGPQRLHEALGRLFQRLLEVGCELFVSLRNLHLGLMLPLSLLGCRALAIKERLGQYDGLLLRTRHLLDLHHCSEMMLGAVHFVQVVYLSQQSLLQLRRCQSSLLPPVV